MLKYFLLFALLSVAVAQTRLYPGYPYTGSTQFRGWSYFVLPLSESTINYVQLVSQVSQGTPFYYFQIGQYPTFQNNIWKYENVSGGNVVQYLWNPNINTATGNVTNGNLYLGIYGYSATKYTITVNTQGPILLYDRQVFIPAVGAPQNTYIYFNVAVDYDLRMFQTVAQVTSALYTANYVYMSNSTNSYPTTNKYQYASTIYNTNGSGYYSNCVKVNYPYPGNYRVAVFATATNYTMQFIENGLGSCGTTEISY